MIANGYCSTLLEIRTSLYLLPNRPNPRRPGRKKWAIKLYALASRYPYVANSRWFEDVVGRQIAAVAETLPPEVVVAAQERGKARDLEATMAEPDFISGCREVAWQAPRPASGTADPRGTDRDLALWP